MKWTNIIGNPKTTIGAVAAIAGIVLCFLKQGDTGVALIGAASVWIGLNSKDDNK